MKRLLGSVCVLVPGGQCYAPGYIDTEVSFTPVEVPGAQAWRRTLSFSLLIQLRPSISLRPQEHFPVPPCYAKVPVEKGSPELECSHR